MAQLLGEGGSTGILESPKLIIKRTIRSDVFSLFIYFVYFFVVLSLIFN